jgi:PPOX class probable F420-dependent enzyme
MTAALPPAVQAIFARPLLTWVTTVRKDGSPHSTVMWADADERGVFFNTVAGSAKLRYLEVNPMVAVSVLDPADALHFASVSGTATIEDDENETVVRGLTRKYLGVDVSPFRGPGERRVTVRVAAEKVIYSPGWS